MCLDVAIWKAAGQQHGRSWGSLGGLLGALGVVLESLGRSWGHLGRSWGGLESSWAFLGRSWKRLGHLGGSGVHLESKLGGQKAPKTQEMIQAENGETLVFDESSMDFNDF